MKLGTFLYGDVRNASGLHGVLQNNQAVDVYGGDVSRPLIFKAPCDGTVGGVYKDSNPQLNGCHFYASGIDLLIHHSNPIKTGPVKAGEEITKSAWHHFHVAVKAGGVWRPIWCYTDPKAVIYTSEDKPPKVYSYSSLPGFVDCDVATGEPININNQTMRISGNFKCKSNNAVWNVRETPSATAKDVGDLSANTEWVAGEIENAGSLVNGTTTWLKYGNGWVSGACLVSCVVETGDPECLAKLAAVTTELEVTKNKAEQLAIDNAALADKLSKFNGATGIIFPAPQL